MHKKGFTIIEIVVVFFLMLGVLFLVYPKSVDSSRQAKLISKWSQKVSELDYMFSVYRAQKDGDFDVKLSQAQNDDARNKVLEDIIRPYLRITSELQTVYLPMFMDKSVISTDSKYYFKHYYLTSTNEIVGLKVINPNCNEKDACFIMSFDINGTNPPNLWGYDIYGIDVYSDKIAPFGKEINREMLKQNCSRAGSGVYCSYYYLIGGKFE